MGGVVLRREVILELFCSKQGEGFRSSAVPLDPYMGQVTLAGSQFTPV